MGAPDPSHLYPEPAHPQREGETFTHTQTAGNALQTGNNSEARSKRSEGFSLEFILLWKGLGDIRQDPAFPGPLKHPSQERGPTYLMFQQVMRTESSSLELDATFMLLVASWPLKNLESTDAWENPGSIIHGAQLRLQLVLLQPG